MPSEQRAEAARRAGIDVEFLDRIEQLGLVKPSGDGSYSAGQIRRAQLVRSLDIAGIPLDGLAEGVRSGAISLNFVETESYERFAAMSDETFAELSQRTGVPFEVLAVVREAIGLPPPSPEDRVREDEMRVVPFVETQTRLGFSGPATQRLLRVTGDNIRRIAEQEADWWRTEVVEPSLAAGATGDEITTRFTDAEMLELLNRANQQLLAIYDARRAHAWTSNIIAGLEGELTRLGLFSKIQRPPAITFLDITGYTRLTQERGDQAAAGLAEQLGRLVGRSAMAHAGKPIKWLGDGVMLYFADPAQAVMGSLEMVDGVADAGLPPAHVGVHAGPVLFQEGDYFGTTVNVAARIADYARPGEVLVSQAVVDAAGTASARFDEVGPVELKGVSGALKLHVARRPSSLDS
jgi:class 3 adenylate cyclase